MDKYITLSFITVFWLLFALVGWLVAMRFKDRGVIRCCVVLTAACCYLVWLITFLMQMNPLVGPRADQKVIYAIMTYWPNSFIHSESDP
ncbi:V-type proton ATPase subunit e [Drosophila miranda]|uniref:V-type proton ATPase subunit e n=1 Tax=Drosophila miranda TaxID=7229 RepID=UPI0007E6B243|nr:V-type proton ATPase subunit e [Drosophila miranda]